MLWAVLFLDLATLPMPQARAGSDETALYRQALADHHVTGAWDTSGLHECESVAKGASDVSPELLRSFIERNATAGLPGNHTIHFSAVGWSHGRAWFQLTSSGSTWCVLYRRAGSSFRLVREVRLPDEPWGVLLRPTF